MDSKCTRIFGFVWAVVFLSVSASGQAIRLSRTSIAFGSVALKATANATVNLTNTGTAPLTISGIAASGAAFSQTNTCPATLARRGACVITVSFTPTATGQTTGAVRITDNAPGSPQSISLQGTGVLPVTLSTSLLSFGNVVVGAKASKTVTLNNRQAVPLSFGGFSASGDFTQSNACPNPLAAKTTCVVTVTFTPTAAGIRTGTLTITDNAGNSPQTAALQGTGSAVTLVSITVQPANPSIPKGTKQQFTATGNYNNATTQNLTTTAIWSSSSVAVATISNAAGSQGLASSVAVGTTRIRATSGAITASTILTVAPPSLASIAVTPANSSIGQGATQQFKATGTLSDATTNDLTSVAIWTSSATNVATMTTTGLATGAGAGITTITASSGAVSGTTPLNVTTACAAPQIDMKVLVVANDGTEVELPAIKQILDYVGTPYTVVYAATGAVTADQLSTGCHAYYQGVIFTFGNLIYSLNGAAALESYELNYGIRQVNWYTYPDPNFGLSPINSGVDTTSSPISASFTTAAQPVFSYVNTANPITIQNAYAYPAVVAGTNTTPLLTDGSGNVLAAIHTTGFAGDWLSLTFDSNQYLTHDLVLAYGLVNWVTKGIFLGDYHVYAAAQVDDFFIGDSEWIPGTPCTNPITHDRTPPDASSLPTFRLKAADMTSLVAWQNKVQTDPLLSGFKLTMAFNGVGTTGNKDWTGLPIAGLAGDDLTSNVHNYEQYFHWIQHTYDHPNTLNGLHKSDAGGDPDTPPVDSIDLEILTNLYVANGTGANLDTDPSDTVSPLHLTDFNPANIVTPGVTGLNDPNVPLYLYQDGIRYAVSDTSMTPTTAVCIATPSACVNNGPNPSPNVGIVNSYEPGIYEVPRHPNDVFFNAASWADDQAEFFCIYNNPVQPPFNTYTGAQILDFVSSSFVNNMLMGDMDPEMFHQPNLHDYDGQGHSLISDTYDQTFNKYKALYKLPVLSLTLDQLGQKMQARGQYNQSGVTATVVPGVSVTITAQQPAVIPVTGLKAAGAQVYGGQNISYITLAAGQSVTLPLK